MLIATIILIGVRILSIILMLFSMYAMLLEFKNEEASGFFSIWAKIFFASILNLGLSFVPLNTILAISMILFSLKTTILIFAIYLMVRTLYEFGRYVISYIAISLVVLCIVSLTNLLLHFIV